MDIREYRIEWDPVDRAEVLERVLDKGIVIDGVFRVHVAGVDLATVRTHMVVLSLDRYKEVRGLEQYERVLPPLPDWFLPRQDGPTGN